MIRTAVYDCQRCLMNTTPLLSAGFGPLPDRSQLFPIVPNFSRLFPLIPLCAHFFPFFPVFSHSFPFVPVRAGLFPIVPTFVAIKRYAVQETTGIEVTGRTMDTPWTHLGHTPTTSPSGNRTISHTVVPIPQTFLHTCMLQSRTLSCCFLYWNRINSTSGQRQQHAVTRCDSIPGSRGKIKRQNDDVLINQITIGTYHS